ncbi:hypothetical protein N7533_011699 [Penicillium manginii]|uniref:uncharacterized protein n=1 Tax=Penicillium manginii TaxID=203109 RepID=UPI0025485AA0|nr:uncharacterized protein N7533_011699 [Penicillium manginii]KAJ5742290.1 hypothetical protein N7533_011699 [Penicillium manginii]
MADPFKVRTLKRNNVKGLDLNAALSSLRPRAMLRSLEASGTARAAVQTPSRLAWSSASIFAIIRVEAKENVRKQILRELRVGHDCNCPNIVIFYALDRVSEDFGPVRVDIVEKITESVLVGVVYLYEAHRIMHRDMEPSNILVNSRGNIKLGDFGVATETVDSFADTFVGTSTYMAPERIQDGAYTHPPISKSSHTPQQSPYTSNSGDISLKIANDFSNSPSYNSQAQPQPQFSPYYSSSRSTHSPPPPSLEHLLLETNDDDDIRSGHRQMRQHLGDPTSAVDAPSRPFMSRCSASSNNTNSRTNLHSAMLPLRTASPNGPPPLPPVSAGGNWRSQPGATSR